MEIVGVRFKGNKKVYYFDPDSLRLKVGTKVIVATEKGAQFGEIVTKKEHQVENKYEQELKRVMRMASKKDIIKHESNLKDGKRALDECKKMVAKMKLEMDLIDASYAFDRKQLTFTFIADERVDFRILVKELASIYKTRIELRQIGVRDKAKNIGGLGPCGRELCCSTFINEFDSVSINMAKNQNLALNPNKISGGCGRLMCCLKYENNDYKKYRRGMPRVGETVNTEKGRGRVIGINIFERMYKVDVPDVGIVVVEEKEPIGSSK